MPSEPSIEPGFPSSLAVQEDVLDLLAQHGVVEDAALRPGAGVVADEDRRAVAIIQPLEHAERLVETLDHLGPLVQVVDQQVAHDPVGVVDQDGLGAGVVGSANGAVGVPRHVPPAGLVLRAGRQDVLRVGNPRNPLHVDGDEDFHPLPPLLAPKQLVDGPPFSRYKYHSRQGASGQNIR